MLDLEISEKINDLISGLLDSREFEAWLYSDSSLENQLGTDLYIELISIDYSKSESKYVIQKLTDGQIDFASIHRLEILDILKSMLVKKGDASDLISKLYHYADIGYYFLAQNDLIANYGEQGKSVLISFDKAEVVDYWDIIKKQDSSFDLWLQELIFKIENDKIEFLNERHIGDYGQISYIYKEK